MKYTKETKFFIFDSLPKFIFLWFLLKYIEPPIIVIKVFLEISLKHSSNKSPFLETTLKLLYTPILLSSIVFFNISFSLSVKVYNSFLFFIYFEVIKLYSDSSISRDLVKSIIPKLFNLDSFIL